MKATISTKYHENCGATYRVVEILKDRIVCLQIGDRKVDFGLTEVSFLADASLGKEIVWTFRGYGDSLLRASGIKSVAAKAAAAWGLSVVDCVSAVNQYFFLNSKRAKL